MEEIWKPVGISKYEVSNLGNIKGADGIRIIKPQHIRGGYTSICFYENGKHIKTIRVHTLVMQIFMGDRPNGMDIDHINRIRDDNRLENLRYCTRSENMMNSTIYDNTIEELDGYKRSLIRAKRNYENNKDKYKNAMKKYVEKNKDKIKEYQKQYRLRKKTLIE